MLDIHKYSIETNNLSEEKELISILEKLNENINDNINLHRHINGQFIRYWEYNPNNNNWDWWLYFSLERIEFKKFKELYKKYKRKNIIKKLI